MVHFVVILYLWNDLSAPRNVPMKTLQHKQITQAVGPLSLKHKLQLCSEGVRKHTSSSRISIHHGHHRQLLPPQATPADAIATRRVARKHKGGTQTQPPASEHVHAPTWSFAWACSACSALVCLGSIEPSLRQIAHARPTPAISVGRIPHRPFSRLVVGRVTAHSPCRAARF